MLKQNAIFIDNSFLISNFIVYLFTLETKYGMKDRIENFRKAQVIDKNMIAYIVASISEFAKTHHISVREVNNYLIRFKGIDFLTEHYDAEHLLSFDDSVKDLTQVCLNNGGGIQ